MDLSFQILGNHQHLIENFEFLRWIAWIKVLVEAINERKESSNPSRFGKDFFATN